jgi:hypothetical protein
MRYKQPPPAGAAAAVARRLCALSAQLDVLKELRVKQNQTKPKGANSLNWTKLSYFCIPNPYFSKK